MVPRLIKTQNYRIKDKNNFKFTPKFKKKNRNILKYISDIPKPLRKNPQLDIMNFTSEAWLNTFPWEEQPHNYQSYRLKEMFQSGISPRAAGLSLETMLTYVTRGLFQPSLPLQCLAPPQT